MLPCRLFGNAVESFAQQFSAPQRQTEAIKHIMRRRKPADSTPFVAPQHARHRGHPLWLPPLPRSRINLPPSSVVEPVADRTLSLSRPLPNLAASTSARGPQAGLSQASSRALAFSPDPTPCRHRPGRHRPQAGSLCSTTLLHHGYVGGPSGSAGTVSRSLASAPQSVSVAPADHQTW